MFVSTRIKKIEIIHINYLLFDLINWKILKKLIFLRFWVLLEHPKKDEIPTMSSISPDPSTNNQSFSNKFSYIPKLLKFMIPLGLVYFFEYLINQGLVSFPHNKSYFQIHVIHNNRFNCFQFELVYFEKIWLTHSEQYRWYQVIYQLGVFTSRTSVSLFPIEKIWILTILQVSLLFCTHSGR